MAVELGKHILSAMHAPSGQAWWRGHFRVDFCTAAVRHWAVKVRGRFVVVHAVASTPTCDVDGEGVVHTQQ